MAPSYRLFLAMFAMMSAMTAGQEGNAAVPFVNAFSRADGTTSAPLLRFVSDQAQVEQLWQRCASYRDRDGRAFPVCLQAAQLGHVRAMTVVGLMLDEGTGTPRDPIAARQWLERASALGNRGAQYDLGTMYEKADGMPQDLSRAAALYLQSAQQGFAPAQLAIGVSYEFGEGVPRDRSQAVYWLSKAGNQGDGRAHWLADWLSRRDTPQFATEGELANYINSRVASNAQVRGGNVCAMAAWVCAKEADSARWKSEYHPPNTPNPYQ